MKTTLFTIFTIIIFSTFISCEKLNAQCIIEQLIADINSSSSQGNGQSFIACNSGLVNQIEFKTLGGWPGTNHTFQLKDSDCNVIWTVNTLVMPNSINFVDLSTGSGTSRTVVSGEEYEFRINSFYTFHISDSNSYLDGERIPNTICNPDAGRDLWFRIAIGTTLPVELTKFTANTIENHILLNWTTVNELNNYGFEVEKSKDGIDWEIVEFVEGQGTTSEVNEYKYQDNNPFLGINYYRLKQIDFDGAFEYSKVIAVEYNTPEKNIQVFPNPSNGVINIQIDNPSNQKMRIKITDNLGRTAWESGLIENEPNWRKEMEIEANGIYFIAAQIGDKMYSERLIINNK